MKFKIMSPDNKTFESDLDYRWVVNDRGIEPQAVGFADGFGRYLANDNDGSPMTTTQIRNFFGEIRKIQMKTMAKSIGEFAMLKPRLAIVKARVRKESASRESKINEFEKVVVHLLDKVDYNSQSADQQFQNFADFVEAIVAFHNAHGGKS
jgi:CRISPR-associated protein Csm2